MSRYARTAVAARPKGPLATIGDVRMPTHEGGAGFAKDARTELFSLAVVNFVGKDTFYERADVRDARFNDLVREVAALDPAWLKAFLPWLRNEANMRTASWIAAVEAAPVLSQHGGGGRQLIVDAMARADEPAEALAYWLSTYGRPIPKPVKRGIADAAVKLYTERSALKYDSRDNKFRMGDVIDMCRPKPKAGWQAKLFQYLMDRRHDRDNPRNLDALGTIAGAREAHRAAAQDGVEIGDVAGVTWESRSANAKMTAHDWEVQIPSMPYMATLRNLRNFEQAEVSPEFLNRVEAKLMNPAEVAASRQLPFRFWSAWKNSGTMRFGMALERALELSLDNIPDFPGRTLVMLDCSASMNNPLAERPPDSRKPGTKPETMQITRREAGLLFGVGVARKSASASLAVYAGGVMAIDSMPRSILRAIEQINIIDGVPRGDHRTNTWPSTVAMWNDSGPFDRILIFTDEQHHFSHLSDRDIPKHVPIYVWNLAGYKTASMDVGSGRYLLGGLTDQMFKTVRMLENAQTGRWPWEES